MRSFGPRKLPPVKRKPAAAAPQPAATASPRPAKPKLSFAMRERQLAEDRRVLALLRDGPRTFDEIGLPAALSRLVAADLVKVVGFRRPVRRAGEEPALFGLTDKATDHSAHDASTSAALRNTASR